MIRVEKVLSKRELKEFIAFPSQLFRDDPNWIEPLHVEREEHLSKKNPGTDHIEWQAWVAKRQGKVVGRITAQIDALHRELHGEDTGHFGMIDAVDDPAVFSTLFTVAEEWLR
ncbi:MAG: N-acetyltransferase, partial [Serratia marcescens]|nr:N-acetyltransferase [Serratia marcescens]